MSKMEQVVPLIKAAGLRVWETKNWTTADLPRTFTPVGVMVHHTGMSVPLSVVAAQTKNRFGGPLCNFIVRESGQVDLVSDGYNYDSGGGSLKVLMEVKNRTFPGGTAASRGIHDDGTGGNAWFIDIEVDHPGNGRRIAQAQYDALIILVAKICEVYGFDPKTQVIGHKEWTERKIDPLWGANHDMPAIRRDVAALVSNVPSEPPQTPQEPRNPAESIFVLSSPSATIWQLTAWAKKRGANERFLENLVVAYDESTRYGVDPAVTAAVMAHETGYGGFRGVVKPWFNNWGGIKVASGGGNEDPDAHAKFANDREGVRAVVQHLALYAGLYIPASEVVDPRHSSAVRGRASVMPSDAWTWASSGGAWSEAIARKVNDIREEGN